MNEPSPDAARATPAERVVVDASALVRFDSSALAVLLESRRDALLDGKGFAVLGLPARLHELAGLYGVAELLSDTPPPGAAAPR